MTTPQDLEEIRKQTAVDDAEIEKLSSGYGLDSWLIKNGRRLLRNRATLLALLSTRAVTQPTREELAQVIANNSTPLGKSQKIRVYGQDLALADAILSTFPKRRSGNA